MTNAAHQHEIDQNFDYMQRNLALFIPDHQGQYALLRNRTIVEFFNRPSAALAAGLTRFPDGLFSIQDVTDEVIDLGFFSHVGT